MTLPFVGIRHDVSNMFAYSGQSYKQFLLVNYASRVVPDWKISHFTTLES